MTEHFVIESYDPGKHQNKCDFLNQWQIDYKTIAVINKIVDDQQQDAD